MVKNFTKVTRGGGGPNIFIYMRPTNLPEIQETGRRYPRGQCTQEPPGRAATRGKINAPPRLSWLSQEVGGGLW